MIRQWTKIAILLILTLPLGVAKAQFVTIKLEIPGSIQFESIVVDPMKGGSWEKSKAITWIEIKVPENLAFILDIQYPERIIEPHLESYYLNNGTSNFEESIFLKAGSQALIMYNYGKVIRNMKPRPLALSAWLGLPMTEGIVIKIEYP
jgi:hypothetical protein